MYVDVFRWIVVITLIIIAVATIVAAYNLSQMNKYFRRPVGGPRNPGPATGTVNPQP